MAISALDNKVEAIMCLEDTNGVFKTPAAGDKNFPLGKVEASIETRNAEGLRDANGTFSPARMFQTGLLGTLTIPSSLMKVDDITTATGEIELLPLFALSGFQESVDGDNKTLFYNGDGNCATGSMRFFNKGCGTSSEGLGTDFRGIHGSLTIEAETAGAEFKVNFEGQAAVEGTPDTTKASIASGYANDAATRATELFIGSVEVGGVATDVEKFSIAMNVELKERKSPETGKNGVDYIYEADVKPTVTITAPLGADTATWWPNVIAGNVISTLTYTGTYWDFELTDLVINSMSREADGQISLTQELSPTTILLTPKAVV
jgi:hypothetical protein